MSNLTRTAASFAALCVFSAVTASVANAQCSVYVSTSGNDSNNGSLSAPFATPARGVQAAGAGSTVCLRGGTYRLGSTLVITKALTLQSYPNEWAVLTADNSSLSTVEMVIAVGNHNVTIKDLEIAGGSYYGIKISPDALGINPAFTKILNCVVHDTGRDAIKAYMADSLWIENNEIYNTGVRDSSNAEGVDIMGAIPAAGDSMNRGATVRRNYIHNTATYGVYMKAGTQSGWIEQNRIDQTGFASLSLGQDSGWDYMRNGASYECSDCVAINNIVSNTYYAGLYCMGAWNPRYENNTLINVANGGQAAIFSAPNSRGVPCTNATYRNNAVSLSSSRPMVHLVSPAGTQLFDYNAYYSGSGTYSFWREDSAAYYWNLSGWQQNTGNDLHTLIGPLQLGSDLAPVSGSPLIDRGTAVNVPIDYAGTTRPQGPAFDIGAYEFKVAAPTLTSVTATGGSGQSAIVGSSFGAALQVRVMNSASQGASGVQVTFTAPASGATATFNGSANITVATDSNGYATTPVPVAQGSAGTYAVTASVSGLASANFSLTNTSPVTVNSLSGTSGSGQSTTVGTAFGAPLQVRVMNSSSQPVAGYSVTFTAPASGATATFNGSPSVTVATDSNGYATSPVPVASLTDGSYSVTASASGLPSAGFGLTNAPQAQAVTAFSTGTAVTDQTITAMQRNQKITISAWVTSPAGVVNGGTVRFTINGASIGTANVVNGSASVVYGIRATSPGARYSIQATYEGNSMFSQSVSNTATLTVVPR
jgi:parallel beta-helix repeat protein